MATEALTPDTAPSTPPQPPAPGRKGGRRGRWLMLHHGLVGGVLGVPLAFFLSGFLYHASGAQQDPATYQIAMWATVPLWTLPASLAYLAPSKRACWGGLLGANALAAAVLYGLAGWVPGVAA